MFLHGLSGILELHALLLGTFLNLTVYDSRQIGLGYCAIRIHIYIYMFLA